MGDENETCMMPVPPEVLRLAREGQDDAPRVASETPAIRTPSVGVCSVGDTVHGETVARAPSSQGENEPEEEHDKRKHETPELPRRLESSLSRAPRGLIGGLKGRKGLVLMLGLCGGVALGAATAHLSSFQQNLELRTDEESEKARTLTPLPGSNAENADAGDEIVASRAAETRSDARKAAETEPVASQAADTGSVASQATEAVASQAVDDEVRELAIGALHDQLQGHCRGAREAYEALVEMSEAGNLPSRARTYRALLRASRRHCSEIPASAAFERVEARSDETP